MGPLMEPVQGLIRSSRMSYTPAAVPSVPQPFPHSGQQTESVAAEPRSRGGGARTLPFYLLPVKWIYFINNKLSVSSSAFFGGGFYYLSIFQ